MITSQIHTNQDQVTTSKIAVLTTAATSKMSNIKSSNDRFSMSDNENHTNDNKDESTSRK